MEETNSKLELSFANFNGPLDLLYNLIKERKFDIMNIDLLYVCTEYCQYVSDNFDRIQTDDIIDDLSMITYFIELKSKKLLPVNDDNDNIDDEIEKDKFIQRILLQKQFKELVPRLSARFNERAKMFNREDNAESSTNRNVYIEDADLPDSISPRVLLNAMQRLYKKMRLEENENSVKQIEIHELSIDDITEEIVGILKQLRDEKISLFLLFNSIDRRRITKQYMAVAFVSILVLARHGSISLRQEENDDDIYIVILDIDKKVELSPTELTGAQDE